MPAVVWKSGDLFVRGAGLPRSCDSVLMGTRGFGHLPFGEMATVDGKNFGVPENETELGIR